MKSKEEPRVVSGGLGWPRVASGGLGWPRKTFYHVGIHFGSPIPG